MVAAIAGVVFVVSIILLAGLSHSWTDEDDASVCTHPPSFTSAAYPLRAKKKTQMKDPSTSENRGEWKLPCTIKQSDLVQQDAVGCLE